MRASRLLAILIMLQLRGRMSASELAAEFEVSVRTIHRDIEQLSAAGVPVYAERGRDGGFQLHDGYRTRLTGFSGEEAQFVLLAGLQAVAADLGVGSELAATQLKLAASLPPDQGARAQAFGERFLFDPKDWYRLRESPPFLPVAANALWQERRLQIEYQSWDKHFTIVVDPLGIVFKASVWYLVAASRGIPKTYRVSAIKSASIIDAPNRRPKRFRLEAYWETRVAEFEASLLKGSAQVRLSPRGLRLLSDISAASAEILRTAKSGPDGLSEATVPIEGLDHAAAMFLRLGDDVEVLSPPELRVKLRDQGQRLAERYSLPARSGALTSQPEPGILKDD